MASDEKLGKIKLERRFAEIPKLWLQLGKMTEDFFHNEMPFSSLSNTIISVAILTFVLAFFSFISEVLSATVSNLIDPAPLINPVIAAKNIGRFAFTSFYWGLVLVPITFYLGNGIMYIGSRIIGGNGEFNSQAYLNSLFFVPLGLILSLFSLVKVIPVAGLFIDHIPGLIIGIINVIFTIRLLKVVHNFSTGRAMIPALIPMFYVLLQLWEMLSPLLLAFIMAL